MYVVRAALVAAAFATGLFAHVGSPDVFFQGKAGPYPLLVAIRPPDVIPGIARIEVRALSADVREIQLTPTPMTGIAATHPPVADIAQRSTADPQFYEGSLWLMSTGSWEVRIRVIGSSGIGELPVPVPAVALKMKPMQRGVSYFLIGMMVFLTVGLVAIVGAGVREAQRDPDLRSSAPWNRRTMIAMVCAAAVLAFTRRSHAGEAAEEKQPTGGTAETGAEPKALQDVWGSLKAFLCRCCHAELCRAGNLRPGEGRIEQTAGI